MCVSVCVCVCLSVCLPVCPSLPLPLSPVCICVCRCMRALWVSLSLPLSLALSFSCPALCLSVSQSLSPSFLEICSCCAVGSLSSPGCSFYLPGSTSRNDPVTMTADKLEVVYIPVTADSKLPAPLGRVSLSPSLSLPVSLYPPSQNPTQKQEG